MYRSRPAVKGGSGDEKEDKLDSERNCRFYLHPDRSVFYPDCVSGLEAETRME